MTPESARCFGSIVLGGLALVIDAGSGRPSYRSVLLAGALQQEP
jgi:hypothetical protein